MRSRGEINLAGLALIRCFDEPGRIPEFISFFEEIGVAVSNPHTFVLEDGSRHGESWDAIYAARAANDPLGLLNPGKVRGPGEQAAA